MAKTAVQDDTREKHHGQGRRYPYIQYW
jgi:hypothetical protein